MMRYHINHEGEVGLCRARIKCPYGDDSQHYSSAEEARQAYEFQQPAFSIGLDNRIKYPRTVHIPQSPGATSDDKVASQQHVDQCLAGKLIVITEKMDGENTTFYGDGYSHARSVDSKYHPSRTYVKQVTGRVARELPPGYRICGENLYAQHSIAYSHLEDYFQVFSVWDQHTCLDWGTTQEIASMLQLATVPVIQTKTYSGCQVLVDEYQAYSQEQPDATEGFVVRKAESFSYQEFQNSLFKYVRPHHVQTDSHWMTQTVTPNRTAK